MADKFPFELVTPERRLISAEIEAVTAPGALGEFGVLPGHRPLLTLLRAGVLTYVAGGKPQRVAISGGYTEVSETGVKMIAETAEAAENIDVARAKAALDRAEADLQKLDPMGQPVETAQARSARDRALARLEAAGNP